MSKHTPGPWEIHRTSHLNIYIGHAHDHPNRTPGYFAEVRRFTNDQQHIEANARLIAAAPEMLEALQSVWLWIENQADAQSKGGHATFDLMMLREQRDIVIGAIAKATGEKP